MKCEWYFFSESGAVDGLIGSGEGGVDEEAATLAEF